MVSFKPRRLEELCGIRIAYMMWTRHDSVMRKSYIEHWHYCRSIPIWKDLEAVVLADVQNLPVLDKWKSYILVPLIPIGQHLLIFLNLWLSKTYENESVFLLTGGILYENLVLNGDGLINQRKTAEKILSNRRLTDVDAFRLASIAFLEVEVLKLWPRVMHYFLNKLVRDNATFIFNEPIELFREYPESRDAHQNPQFNSNYVYKEGWSTFLSESHEVLFWITHCLSKEQGTDIHAVPHFLNNVNWHDYSIESAYHIANVAVLDYYQCCNSNDFLHFKEKAFEVASNKKDLFYSLFAFHISQFTLSEIKDLFEKNHELMVIRFLQWPLSASFLENTEEIWSLIPDEKKSLVFRQLIAILYRKHHTVKSTLQYYFTDWAGSLVYSRLHCMDHIRSIFLELWKISSDSYKVDFLNLYVFQNILSCYRGQGRENFGLQFESKGFKQKLLNLFLANESSVLELYEGKCVPSSLKSIVAKYMPEHMEELETGFMSFLNVPAFNNDLDRPLTFYPRMQNLFGIRRRAFVGHEGIVRPRKKVKKYRTQEDFINYVKGFILSNNIDN